MNYAQVGSVFTRGHPFPPARRLHTRSRVASESVQNDDAAAVEIVFYFITLGNETSSSYNVYIYTYTRVCVRARERVHITHTFGYLFRDAANDLRA